MDKLNLKPVEQPIRDLIAKIEDNRFTNPSVVLDLSQELLDCSQSAEREDLYGYALFSRAYAFYNLNDITQAFLTFEKALSPLSNTRQWELLARAHCAMGIISNSQGNAPMAMDHYLRGISVCEKHGITAARAVIDCNIGLLYLFYHDLKNAELYFRRSINRVEAVRKKQGDYEPTFSYPTVATLYFNMANVAVLMGKMDEAVGNLKVAYELELKAPDEGLRLAMKMLKVQILYAKGRQMLMEECIAEVDRSDFSCGAIIDAFDDFVTYAAFLQHIGRDKEFGHIITRMEESVRVTNSVFLYRRLVQLKVEYYKSRNRQKEYLMEAGLFYELSMKMERELENSYRESLSTRMNLENEKRSKEALKTEAETFKLKSEVDALTGLRNRYKISEIAESSFAACIQKQQSFTVEILDIDYFKQYNDNYGHQEGDGVLVMVAAALRSIEKYPDIYTGRYGGDEFVVLYINHTCEEVEGYAQELKQTVEKMNILHEYSPISDRVTLSQGLYHSVPHEQSKFWDFLHAADQALYDVKKTGRNDFRISTEHPKK